MNTVSLDLEDDLAALLQATNQPIHHAAREFIILEHYRRGAISSGKKWLNYSICPAGNSFATLLG